MVSAERTDRIQAASNSLAGFGLDPVLVADWLTRHGAEGLELAVEALRRGFSREFVADFMDKIGPTFLGLVISFLNKKKAKAIDGEIVVGDDVAVESSVVELLIEKYLPILLNKYADQLVQLLVQAIANVLKPKTA